MQKLSTVFTAHEDDGFIVLSEKLSRHGIGALVILDKTGGLAGIISERDMMRAVARSGSDVFAFLAKDIMTRDVYVCEPHDTELQVMRHMLEKRIRHMPVMEKGKVIGMVSLGEAIKSRLIEIGQILFEGGPETGQSHRHGSFTKHLHSRLGTRQ